MRSSNGTVATTMSRSRKSPRQAAGRMSESQSSLTKPKTAMASWYSCGRGTMNTSGIARTTCV
eukprot:2149928-Prymnesium_polylepis.1